MKIALAQLNPTVGDIPGNLRKARVALHDARRRGARLVVFPEMTLIGYPPRDLLLKTGLVEANLDALGELAAECTDIAAVVGFVDRNASGVGRPLKNLVALLDGGRVVARKAKTLLPTYDVFDEARYFEPDPESVVVEVDGMRLGLSVCEDAWNPEDEPGLQKRYDENPIEAIGRQGADVLINCSASPFTVDKYRSRVETLRRHATRHGLSVVYCNQVGGNDELLFDGASLVMGPDGALLAQATDFEEDLVVVEVSARGEAPARPKPGALHEPHRGVAAVHAALVMGLRDYMHKTGFRAAVLGLSGGIDSAVVACLAAEALGPEHVVGIGLPSRYSSESSTTDAEALARNLGITYKTIPIGRMHEAFETALADVFHGTQPGVTEENIQARIRGVVLMAYSNKFGHLLLATGNKSELATGYCTLYGDMCGGLAPIGDLPKLMVYDLARYINREREIIPRSTIEKPPSAELRPDQTDQDLLPPYDEVDRIVQLYVEEMAPLERLIAEGIDPDDAERMVRMIDTNEYKRRQAAPVLKITGRAFGIGRRMPIVQRFIQPLPKGTKQE